MKLFQSLWVLTDNDAMDVTQIESHSDESPEVALYSQHTVVQYKYDYSNIIDLFPYLNKMKNSAYQS